MNVPPLVTFETPPTPDKALDDAATDCDAEVKLFALDSEANERDVNAATLDDAGGLSAAEKAWMGLGEAKLGGEDSDEAEVEL